MIMQTFLNKFKSKSSANKSVGTDIYLGGRRKTLPPSEVYNTLDTLQLYQEERLSCERYRLTFQIETLCTNILNNSITEIVGNEGSDDTFVINYGPYGNLKNKSISEIKYKSKNLIDWFDDSKGTLKAIRDTQLSNYITYHCGKDIFNNHLLRSKTFKTVCPIKDSKDVNNDFNTISDTMRNGDGIEIIDDIIYPASANIPNGRKKKKLHLYTYDDIMSYDDTLDKKLHKTFNGWYGFYNSAKIDSYYNENESIKTLNLNRVNIKFNPGDFVDIYPCRDLYSFVPKYNPYKGRIEKNWEYCLTYPSKSIIDGIDFLGQGVEADGYHRGAIKVVLYDENTKSDNGTGQIIFYSSSKHGLNKGDRVNIYNGDNLIIDSVEVKSIFDSFIFITDNHNTLIGKQWMSIKDLDRTLYKITKQGSAVARISDGKEYRIVNKRVNLDDTAQNISFKKVSNGTECDYYVRIFSRIPNFRFADRKPSEEELYKNNEELIREYQKPENDFESHCTKLAFAKNIYSDQIGEIVYTDDIDINGLHDNLGRPLTSIYLTILKNNSGYKYWYGKDKKEININHETIEYSHCFGKLTTQFHKSEEAMNNGFVGITNINCIDGHKGLSITSINERDKSSIMSEDEIDVKNDTHFYGDFVCYDSDACLETVIDDALYRFNTAQRELIKGYDAAYEYFNNFYYDEIASDDYDLDDRGTDKTGMSYSFELKTKVKNKACQKKEGYYYKPHYEIKLRTYGPVKELHPEFLRIRSMVVNNDNECTFNILQEHNLKKGNKVIMYDADKRILYSGLITNIIDNHIFSCIFYRDYNGYIEKVQNGEIPIITSKDSQLKLRYRIFNTSNLLVPSYYSVSKDSSCTIKWREIIQNGFENNTTNSTIYPFTNGAIYINKKFSLKLRRQDPFDLYGLWASESPYDPAGVSTDSNDKNNYVKADDIVC